MTTGKILFLGREAEDPSNDTGINYMREFIRNGALHLDHTRLYLKYGHRKAQDFIRDFIEKNGITTLVFSSDPASFDFSLEFFEGLRESVFTAMMSADSVYFLDVRDKYYARAMDLVIVTDSYETPRAFREAGAEPLIFMCACDRETYFKLGGAAKTIDVSFVGGLAGREERRAYIDHLAANGIDVRVFGLGAPGGRISMDRKIEIFNTSRINLNFTDTSATSHLFQKDRLPGNPKQLKGRTVEAALCGSFVLSEYAPGIENVLLPDKEMAVFRSREELLEKVRFYLANETEREAIAERGYQRAIKEYDVRLAIPRLMAELEIRRGNKARVNAPAAPDAVFEKNFASYRFLWILKFLKRFKFLCAFEELGLILRAGKIDPSQFYTFFVEEVVDKFPRVKALLKKVFFRKKAV